MNPMCIPHATVLVAPILAFLAPSTKAQHTSLAPRPIAAQVEKPMPAPDPVKGFDRVEADTAAPLERTPASRQPHARGQVAERILAQGPATRGTVLFADAADGKTWASGDTYKAAFGRDGFTYVPFLGSDAPRNYPVQFVLEHIAVGGQPVEFERDVAPLRQGQRVVFERGVIQEIYDLASDGVEQTFVVADAAAGDVTVELRVRGELVEDAAQPGLQFTNQRGGVRYGDAFVVDGTSKRAIPAAFADGKLRLHVSAAQRPVGALVIDPIISTTYVASNAQDCAQSDVAYDATNARYMLVWQRTFSQTDIDVWSEMRDASGSLVVNSAVAIDNSSAFWRFPRVANLNAYDRFLVVAEVYVAGNAPGQQFTVWGRTVDAAAPFPRSGQFLISSTHSGDKREPDVGGDPSLTTPSYWTVAYTRDFSSTDRDIHARQVEATGVLRPGTILVEDTVGTIYHSVAISQSNGDVAPDRRRWALVYTRQHTSGDGDIYGATLTWDGQIAQPSTAIDSSIADTFQPCVSSALDLGTRLQFAVVYHINSTAFNLAGQVVDGQLQTQVANTSLSSLLGATGVGEAAVETDGCRFVVALARQSAAYLATLAVAGTNLVVHEAPQLVDSNHDANTLQLIAQASGGRASSTATLPTTRYGLVYVDRNAPVDRVVFTTYEGHGRGGFASRAYGCGGLGIAGSGQPWLGGDATITLANVGSDVPGLLVGTVSPALMICSGCRVGLNVGGPLIHVPNVATVTVPIPRLTHLVGAVLSVQGYAAGSGACLGTLRLSDALDITLQ